MSQLGNLAGLLEEEGNHADVERETGMHVGVIAH